MKYLVDYSDVKESIRDYFKNDFNKDSDVGTLEEELLSLVDYLPAVDMGDYEFNKRKAAFYDEF